MYEFNYHRPADLAEAKRLFEDADDGLYLAGGHTLIPSLKQRLIAPSDVIDLADTKVLNEVALDDSGLRIGALTTHATVASSPIVRGHASALCDLAGGIGDAQVRNRGTIGGSLANNDPAADYPAAILGFGAKVHTDQRTIDADDFLTGMFETALQPGEIITSVSFPAVEAAGYAKFLNPASRYAVVGVMVVRQGAAVRVAITGAAACAFRAQAFEEALSADFSAAALDQIALGSTDLLSDMHASAEYRAHLCGVMTARVVAGF